MILTLASCDVVELAGIFGGDRGRAEEMLNKSEEYYSSGYEQSSTAEVKVTLSDNNVSSTVNSSSLVRFRDAEDGIEHYASNEVRTLGIAVNSTISYDGETVRVSDTNNGFYGMGSCTEEEYYEMYSRFRGNGTEINTKSMIASFSDVEIENDADSGEVCLRLSGIKSEEDNPCYKQLDSVFAPYGRSFDVSVARVEYILSASSYKLVRQNIIIEASSDKLKVEIDSTTRMLRIDDKSEIIKNSSEPLEELENIKDAYIACLDIAALPSAKSMSFSHFIDQIFDTHKDMRVNNLITGSFVNDKPGRIDENNGTDDNVSMAEKANRTYKMTIKDLSHDGISDVVSRIKTTVLEYDGYTYTVTKGEEKTTKTGVEATEAFAILESLLASLKFNPGDITAVEVNNKDSERTVAFSVKISEAERKQLLSKGYRLYIAESEGALTKTVTVSYGEDGVIKSIVTVFDFDDGRGNKVNMLSEFRIEEAVM